MSPLQELGQAHRGMYGDRRACAQTHRPMRYLKLGTNFGIQVRQTRKVVFCSLADPILESILRGVHRCALSEQLLPTTYRLFSPLALVLALSKSDED